ncbi:hypothetical protein LCGC14_0249390 [marine sediment metagenome]|uniref:Uncharacterized protein n=1 Tax=marine sediment metagenome TaxID=412755 RepID=A0A0F9WQA7_9ZZZZ
MSLNERDVERIHTRLDEIVSDLSEAKTDLRVVVEKLETHDRIIMGNGKDSVDSRLTKLETVSGGRSKGSWIILAAIIGTVFSLIVSGVTVLAGHLITGN